MTHFSSSLLGNQSEQTVINFNNKSFQFDEPRWQKKGKYVLFPATETVVDLGS